MSRRAASCSGDKRDPRTLASQSVKLRVGTEARNRTLPPHFDIVMLLVQPQPGRDDLDLSRFVSPGRAHTRAHSRGKKSQPGAPNVKARRGTSGAYFFVGLACGGRSKLETTPPS